MNVCFFIGAKTTTSRLPTSCPYVRRHRSSNIWMICDQQVEPPSISDFADENFCFKSAATKILHY